MKNLRKISLVLVLALIVGTFGNVLPASAAKEVKSSWSFKTTSGKTVGVNKELKMERNEYQNFNLFKSGKEVKINDSRYTITWSSSNKDVIYVDPSNGRARVDKFKKLSADEYYEATVTANIYNKITRAKAKRGFKVTVGTPRPTVEYISLQFKDGIDPTQALKIDQSYTLETLAYDKDDQLIADADAGLYYAYFCDKTGITISGSTIKPITDGEYTITVGAFEKEAEAKAATSADDAAYVASLKNIVVEANKPQITDLRQVDLYTVALTFNKAEYATDLLNNSNKLTINYNISGYPYTIDFQDLTVDEDNPATVLITLYSGLTEGIPYTFTYKSTETVSANVTGSGTKPARIELVSEAVEVEREYYFKVKVLNDKDVDITDVVLDTYPYTCTFESLESGFSRPYLLSGNQLYFFQANQTAVIQAKLNLGYDTYGNPLAPLTYIAEFTSIPKAEPIYGSCTGYALASATDTANTLTYNDATKTLCLGDTNIYLYATFPYTDEIRENHTRYIVKGYDAADSKLYTYRSSDPTILEVDATTGMLHPFATGSAAVYVSDINNRIVGVVGINVSPARTLSALAITDQSSTRLSATGDTTDNEYVTVKLTPMDQYGDKISANYTFGIAGTNDLTNNFHSLFNSTLQGDTLKIWEGALLDDIVTPTNPIRNFTITVTAENGLQKLPPQSFDIMVKNVTNSTTTSPKLVISQSNIDMKLDKNNLKDYESVIQVISVDNNDFFVKRENLKLINNANNADTQKDAYSILILHNNKAVTDSILPIELTNNQLILKPVTSTGGNEIKKASVGSYSIQLYRGNGTKAQPLSESYITLIDTTQPIKVSIKDKNISDTSFTTLKNAITFKRDTSDISSHIEIVDITPRRVNTTYQISEMTLKIKAKEFNADWPSADDYTYVKLTGLNLQFKLSN